MGPLVLISDFGAASPYPGQMAMAARSRGWQGAIVQLWHEWPSYRTDLGPVLLPRMPGTLPQGAVVVTVVDPGVGSDRDVLAVSVDGVWWVAPDNGLLSSLIADGAPSFSLARYRPATGSPQTFHGRDWMVPAAVDCLMGVLDPTQELPARTPVILPSPPPGLAFWDTFGNAVTTVPWDSGAIGAWWGREGALPQVEHFSQLPPGKLGAVRGSMGLWELAVAGASARQFLDGTLDQACWKSQ